MAGEARSGPGRSSDDAAKVAVIVPTLDGRDMLRECCAALRRQEFREFRVRVVDNGSTDGTREMLASDFPEVDVVRLRRNRGFAAAVNSGVAAGDEPYVALLNNDAVPEPRWLGELVERGESVSQEGSWASVLLWADRPGTIQSAGLSVHRDGTPARLRDGEPVESLPRAAFEVLGASGGAALYRRSMLERLGSFDERFFAYAEDVDLSLRARLMGYSCALVPTARVVHRHMSTAKRTPNLAAYLHYRNVVLYLVKTMPLRRLIAQLPRFSLTGLRPLLKAPWSGEGWALLAARFGIAKHLPHALRERVRLRRRARVAFEDIEPLFIEPLLVDSADLSPRRGRDGGGGSGAASGA